jgi:hypothetical protein
MRIDFELSGTRDSLPLPALDSSGARLVRRALPADATCFCGAVVVEHRYTGPIVGGAIGDGLVVQ